MTDDDFADRFVQTAVSEFGGLDIIVNNAGYTWDSVIQKMTDEQWDAILDVHLKAPFRILRAAQPVIAAAVKEAEGGRYAGAVPQGRQHLVHRRPRWQRGAGELRRGQGRCHRPHQDVGQGVGPLQRHRQHRRLRLIRTRLTEAAADDAGTIDIDGREIAVGVNPTLLSAMEQMIPLGRSGTPEEAAGAVYLMCAPESDYVSGQTLVCGGGFMI